MAIDGHGTGETEETLISLAKKGDGRLVKPLLKLLFGGQLIKFENSLQLPIERQKSIIKYPLIYKSSERFSRVLAQILTFKNSVIG